MPVVESRGAGLGLLRDLLDETIVTGSVDLGHDTDDQTDDQSEDDGEGLLHGTEEIPAQPKRADDHDDSGGIAACFQGLVGVGIFVAFYKEASQNGSRDAQGSDEQREDGSARFMVDNTQSDGGDNGADIGLEEVCAHACDVAYVVAYVIGDNSGVAGVVLGDTCLDFTDQVGTDVCGLGVDTAADTREKRDRRGAQGEAGEDIGIACDKIDHACADQTEAHDAHAHDCAARESDGEGGIHAAVFGGSRCADICPGRHVHADETGRCGEYCSDQEAVGCQPADSQADQDE